MILNETERTNVERLAAASADYAVFELTETGLAKSTLDATALVREYLERNSIHEYSSQLQGPDHKVVIRATLVLPDGARRASRATLYRPRSKGGDPRIWFSRLGDLCNAGDKFAAVWDGTGFDLYNLSRPNYVSSAFPTSFPEASSGTDADHWTALGRLWERATGGGDVAARPDAGVSSWPVVARAPGVDAAWAWLAEGVESGARPRAVFLIGGPGAGKSHAAAAVVERLKVADQSRSVLANRSYDYVVGEQKLTIINDATIRGDEPHRETPLARDFGDALKYGSHLLACVNRGILIEESAEIRAGASGEGLGAGIVAWLQQLDDVDLRDTDSSEPWSIRTTFAESYVRSAVIAKNGDAVADLVAVYVDVCSLLEREPKVSIESSGSGNVLISANPYSIGDVRDQNARLASPGGNLLAAILESIGKEGEHSEDANFLNPLIANEISLSHEQVRAGALAVLRASEIISGQRFTFREMWGAAVRLLVGNAPERIAGDHIQSLIASLQPTAESPYARFLQVRELADLRYSQALFDAAGVWAFGAEDALRNPVTKLTWAADPLRDTDPGHFDPVEPTSGWATPIAEAFSGPVASGSPLETLVDSLPRDDQFHKAITAFDWSVDTAFVSAVQMNGLTDRDRFELIAWYGAYLTRLYAVANGISAFRRDVASWTTVWHLSPGVPSDIASHLRTLLRPKKGSDSDSVSVIPVFDSRTYPIVGDVDTPKLALRSGDFELETERAGERIQLRVLERGRVVSSIALDFPLVREAASCVGNTMGITDVSDDVSPRLERFRSMRLLPEQVRSGTDYAVLSGGGMTMLQIGR
nr:hypothetical protein [Leifsonia sp. Leaf325]